MTLTPKAALELRSRLFHLTRLFFHERGFTEVETPIRIKAPAQETHINCEPSGDRWLRASPELQMKRLLALGHEKIFQIGPCFRRGERGDRHNPEYTMLEWYRANADYSGILADTRALIARVAADRPSIVYRGQRIDLLAEWPRITVRDAFVQWAGWDPVADWNEDRFNVDLVEKVEPALPKDVPVILTDYPAPAASLARRKPGNPGVAERWELYIGGLEIANAYSELTDVAEQRARFEVAAAERRAMGKDVYPFDEDFFTALAAMPPSGGIALGMDRLVMLFADAADIGDVLAFRE